MVSTMNTKQSNSNVNHLSSWYCLSSSLVIILFWLFTSVSNAAPGCGATGGDPAGCEQSDAGSAQGSSDNPGASAGNPINIITGNKYQREVDHDPYIGDISSKLTLIRHYNSNNASLEFGFGPGWGMTYSTSIGHTNDNELQIVQSDGRRILLQQVTNTASKEARYQAINFVDGYVLQNEHHYRWYMQDGRTLYFNQLGQLTRIYNNNGETLTLVRNKLGWLAEVRDDDNNRITLHYFDTDKSAESDRKQVTILGGRIRKIVLPDGDSIQYRYGEKGNLVQLNYPNGTQRHYHYEDSRYVHALTGITNEEGTRYVTWGYDEQGRGVLSELNDKVNRVTFEYQDPQKAGELGSTLLTNSLEQQTVYRWKWSVHEAQQQLISSEGPGCSTCAPTGYEYRYNERHQLTEKKGDGTTLRYQYDTQGRLLRVTEQVTGQPEKLYARMEYGDDGHLADVIARPSVNPNGEHKLEYIFNEKDQLIRLTEKGFAPDKSAKNKYIPIHRTVMYTYDGPDLISVDDARTDVDDMLQMRYDNKHRLTQVKSANGTTQKFLRYDRYDRPTKFVPYGAQAPVEIAYNDRGLPIEVVMDKTSVRYRYDSAYKLTSATSSDGESIRIKRDDAGRPIEVTDSEDYRIVSNFDTENKFLKAAINSPNGDILRMLSYVYDDNNRVQAIEQDGRTTEYVYNENSQPTKIIDAVGNAIKYDYDSLGRVLSLAQSNGTSAKFLYGENNQFVEVIDARGNSTKESKDDFGNIVETHNQDTGTVHYEHDMGGNIVKKVDALGNIKTYSYDVSDRLISQKTAEGESNISYHKNGKVKEIKGPYSRESYEYDNNGNIVKHTRYIDELSFITSYRFDQQTGKLTHEYLPDGQTLRYHYHKKGPNKGTLRALTREDLIGQTTIIGELNTEADNATTKHFIHGNGLTTNYRYNSSGKLVDIVTGDVQTLEYVYDEAGNITGVSTDHFVYDTVGRLIKASTSTGSYDYEYDILGNVTRKTEDGVVTDYSYCEAGEGNRLIKVANGTHQEDYTYDKSGSPLHKGSLIYEYNVDQRPTKFLIDGKVVAEYTYNDFGERIKKTIYNATTDKATTTFYLYDGGKLVAEANQQGEITAQYLYLDHHPVAKLEGETIYAIHNDHLGTPRVVTDEEQNPVWQASFTPFGQAKTNIEKISLNLRFPGQYYDDESGIHYNYLRNYDPQIGRYLEPDPIGLQGGLNLYAYVSSDPVNSFDPFGLTAIEIDSDYQKYYDEILKTKEGKASWERAKNSSWKTIKIKVDWSKCVASANPDASDPGTLLISLNPSFRQRSDYYQLDKDGNRKTDADGNPVIVSRKPPIIETLAHELDHAKATQANFSTFESGVPDDKMPNRLPFELEAIRSANRVTKELGGKYERVDTRYAQGEVSGSFCQCVGLPNDEKPASSSPLSARPCKCKDLDKFKDAGVLDGID